MFSIIVPVYNRENNISNVITSVLKQEYENWELIVVDDGSNDNTKNIIEKFVNLDCRIRYYYQMNAGVSSARNQGLALAEGEYIIFLDSDNSLRSNALRILADNIKVNQQVDMMCYGFAGSEFYEWRPDIGDGNNMISKEKITDVYLPEHINLCPQNKHFLKNFVWNKCYRKSFLSNYNIKFDEGRRTWEDGIFVVNCLDSANQILLIPQVIYNAYCDGEIDHLSAKIFENQLFQYIEDESGFKERFEKRYNFADAYYCSSNIKVLKMLFERIISKYKEPVSKNIIQTALEKPIVQFWCEHVTTEDLEERRFLELIKTKNVNKIYAYYHSNIFMRSICKVKRTLKKVYQN